MAPMSPQNEDDVSPAGRSYVKLAFANPYNLSLLIGGVAASLLTANPIPAVIAVGGEALWLLHAPDSRFLRKIWWDPRFEQMRLAIEARQREQRMQGLPPDERNRVNRMVEREAQINRLAAQNPSFTGELLRTELVKTQKLVESFLDMAVTCNRYEQYLGSVDLDALDKDRQRWQARCASDKTPDAERDIAKKNLAVIEKRLDKLRDIRNYLGIARGQLDLIENSFQLIADQIVTMQSPNELSGQLDDLLTGVESVQETARDTEKILSTMEVRA
jgi:hypothetical protein